MPSRAKPFPPEVRERAVRMVLDHEGEYESQWAAIVSISEKLGHAAASTGAPAPNESPARR